MIQNSDKETLLKEALTLVSKHSVTAYEIEKNTSLSAVGVQKIIDGVSKRPQNRTLETIISYIINKYESSVSIIEADNNNSSLNLTDLRSVDDESLEYEVLKRWLSFKDRPRMKVVLSGYADVKVSKAVAEITKDRESLIKYLKE